jgi:hypothetical protein
VQLLHNTNVPSCYAAADNRLRQSADWCRRMPSPPLRAIRRRWLPALARIAHAKQRPDRPVAVAAACQADAGLGCRVLGASGYHAWAGTAYPFRTWRVPRPAPLHAAHATPRHTTPYHATPVVRDRVAGPVPHWSGRCSSATGERSAVATRPSHKAEAAAEAAAVPTVAALGGGARCMADRRELSSVLQ